MDTENKSSRKILGLLGLLGGNNRICFVEGDILRMINYIKIKHPDVFPESGGDVELILEDTLQSMKIQGLITTDPNDHEYSLNASKKEFILSILEEEEVGELIPIVHGLSAENYGYKVVSVP